ncbi:MAG: NAD(P)H-dependent flavin oxidoreductase [Deltaproteobacteria bacterium]
MKRKSIAELLGIELPIIQAPMAGSQGSPLAIAVSEAGGLGSLPCAMLAPDAMRRELSAIKSATSKPVSVNFFCHAAPKPDPERERAWREILAPYYREFQIDIGSIPAGGGREPFGHDAADVIAEFKPAVVSFHFGLPSGDLLRRAQGSGAKILSTATTVNEALWLEERGVDAVIAQGLEAGGHRGMFLSSDVSEQAGTFVLVPQIVQAVKIPVIAAGGIADARAVAAAISLGASGVQVGTAYLLCPEAATSPVHRSWLAGNAARHTAITNILSGRPARGIVNRIIRELGLINPNAPEFPLASAALAPIRAKAESMGIGDFSPLWAGQNIGGCAEVPAAALTARLAEGVY